MGILERSLEVTGQKTKRVMALFDSGSSYSYIKRSIVDSIGFLEKDNVVREVEIGNGKKMRFKERVVLKIKLNSHEYFYNFLVGDIPDEMIIGVDFMQDYEQNLVFKNDTVVGKNLHLKTKRGQYVL